MIILRGKPLAKDADLFIEGTPIEKKPILVDGSRKRAVTAEEIQKATLFGAADLYHDSFKYRVLKGWRVLNTSKNSVRYAKLGLSVHETVALYPLPGAKSDDLLEEEPYEVPIDDRTPLMGARFRLMTITGTCAETFPAKPTNQEFFRLAHRWLFQRNWAYWQHIVVSHTSGSLTINALKQVKREFIGDNREAYQIFHATPKSVGDGTAHLWHHLFGVRGVRPDGAVLPLHTRQGTT